MNASAHREYLRRLPCLGEKLALTVVDKEPLGRRQRASMIVS